MHFQIPQKPDELRPIGDLIKSLNSCIYLYPKLIPKDVAFEKYYTRGTVTRVNGYKLIERKFALNTLFNFHTFSLIFFILQFIAHRIKH